jgi:LuxR family transcriptional regulator, maltose regulon positive regulatory protein
VPVGQKREQQPTLDVIEAKVRPPALRHGVVPRTALVNGLRREAAPLVAVTAPAGYGKTTLLAEWAAAESRPVAWLSLDSHDNDPPTLLRHVVAAVDGGRAVHPRLVRALAADPMRNWKALFDEVTSAFRSLRRAQLFVFDNVDLLRAGDARRMLPALIAALPEGSTTALASRVPPKLAAARLRATGPMRQIGIEELTLGDRDARLLLEKANPNLSDGETSRIIAACEGWPTGLYLAGLAAGSETGGGAHSPAGNDRYLADYIRAEFLSQLNAKDISFLRRTAILDELLGPLCDAVLQDNGSAQALTRLSHAKFVRPLEGKRGTYRVPGLVRDVLARELLIEEPRLVPALHRSAADWYEARGKSEPALEHAQNAGDARRVAAILTATALPLSSSGRAETIDRAFAAFAQRWPLERYPAVAVHGSRLHAWRGRTGEARKWLEIAERAARRGGPDAPHARRCEARDREAPTQEPVVPDRSPHARLRRDPARRNGRSQHGLGRGPRDGRRGRLRADADGRRQPAVTARA